ncbi:hypothetical protein BD289DRAFT_134046 [Coniella lustricola]|uniref:Uncharacterized protein n=1 Tax=Coniella lustricola TaxID=2025994 RepID=A0A2T2ZVR8_9PEZI|nr:hypothetical protein BD289DRAFT_134046 [Coniella lustricola]
MIPPRSKPQTRRERKKRSSRQLGVLLQDHQSLLSIVSKQANRLHGRRLFFLSQCGLSCPVSFAQGRQTHPIMCQDSHRGTGPGKKSSPFHSPLATSPKRWPEKKKHPTVEPIVSIINHQCPLALSPRLSHHHHYHHPYPPTPGSAAAPAGQKGGSSLFFWFILGSFEVCFSLFRSFLGEGAGGLASR